jgi:hypothetical protein
MVRETPLTPTCPLMSTKQALTEYGMQNILY